MLWERFHHLILPEDGARKDTAFRSVAHGEHHEVDVSDNFMYDPTGVSVALKRGAVWVDISNDGVPDHGRMIG
ncbi:MAG: hypothetical protein ABF370_14120 [Verrucomicrobiales bacterium]